MGNSKTLIDILTIFFKHKLKFLLILVSTIGIMAVGFIYTTPIYEAKASILVKFGREHGYNNLANDAKHPSNDVDRGNVINNELEILSSRELIEELLTSYGIDRIYQDIYQLYPDYQDRVTHAIEKFIQDFSVTGVANSDLIRMSFKHKEPQTASSLLNIMTDMYKIKRLRTFRDEGSMQLLKERVAYYQKNLTEVEDKLQDFKKEYQTYSFENQVNLLLTQKSSLDTSRKDVQRQIPALDKKLEYLYQKRRQTDPTVELYRESNKQNTDRRQEELISLKTKEQELLKTYKTRHPLVQSVRKDILQAENLIKSQEEQANTVVKVGRNSLFEDIEKDIINTEAELNSQKVAIQEIAHQISELDNKLRWLSGLEQELKDLQRQAKQYEGHHRSTLQKLETIRLADEMDRQQITNIRMVQTATPPTEPINTHRKIKLMLGVMLGMAAGMVVTLGSEYLGQGLATPTIAQKRLNLPVLTAVATKHMD